MQLDLLENLEHQQNIGSSLVLVGFNAALVVRDSEGNIESRTGFNWSEKFATAQEVKHWESSLRVNGRISSFESMEPVAVYAASENK